MNKFMVMLIAGIIVFGPGAIGIIILLVTTISAGIKKKNENNVYAGSSDNNTVKTTKRRRIVGYVLGCAGIIWTVAILILSAYLYQKEQMRVLDDGYQSQKQAQEQNKRKPQRPGLIRFSDEQYVYTDPEVAPCIALYYSEYDDGEFKLHFEDIIDEECSFAFYDSEFNRLDSDEMTITCSKKVLTVKGKQSGDISGMVIQTKWSNCMIYLRYLDSSQYAILVDYWADDLGWDRCYGDPDLYYTTAEIAEEKAKKEKEKQIQKERMDMLSGYWRDVNGGPGYIYFFSDDYGNTMECYYLNDDGQYVSSTYGISRIDMNVVGSTCYVNIIDGIGWGLSIPLIYSEEDMTLEDCSQGGIYKKE